MKHSLTLLMAAASAFGAAFALAQDERQPPAPDAVAAAAAAPATPPAPPDTPAPPPPAASSPAPSATPPPAPDQQPTDRRPGRHGPADTGFIDGDRSQSGKPPGDGPQHPGAAEHSERGPGGEHRDHSQRPGDDRHESPSGAWRGPDGGNRGNGPGHEQRPPMPPMPPMLPPKPMPFIGVVTAPVPPLLAAQLGLAEDFGLVVEAVMPNSPAATAGLQKFDVLKLYNDQQIVDVRQLAILVRATGKDGSASLTIIRKAQEQKIAIKVGEHIMPNLLGGAHPPGDAAHGPGPHGFSFMHPGFEHPRFANQDSERHHAEQPDADRGDGNRHESRRPGSDRERFAQDHFDRHERSEGPNANRAGGDRQGDAHHGFARQRFGHERFERGGRDQERSCRGGFAPERSGRECHQHHHHGFDHRNRHHGSDGQGFHPEGCEHHRFGWNGFHHRGSGPREFAHSGSERDGFERERFHRGGFDHERFARDDRDREGGDRQGWHHGSRDQTWEHGGFNHSQPSDKAGRRPDVRGPNPENRNRDFQKRTEDGHHHSSIDNEQPPSELPPLQPANLLREIRPGGAAEIRITQPAGTVVYDTANARVQFSDAAMKIEIVTKEGHRTLRATDLEGATLFEGALETAEQVKSVPEDIRKKLDWIEARSRTEVVTAPPQEIPAETEAANSNLDGGSVL